MVCVLLAGLVFASHCSAAEAQIPPQAWQSSLTPRTAGTFPMIAPFTATFRFGWGRIEAAQANATVTTSGPVTSVTVRGGTVGAARALWKIDVVHNARFLTKDLNPLGFEQKESYGSRRVLTRAEFRSDGLWRIREHEPSASLAKWKPIRIEPIRDIVSAMFFVRSQSLTNGQTVGLIAFPGDAPFLVEAKVLGRDKVRVGEALHPAIKLEMRLQRLRLEKGRPPRLEEHGKFRRGTVWISDDANRLPLRAEVEIFVGSVFAELVSCSLPGFQVASWQKPDSVGKPD